MGWFSNGKCTSRVRLDGKTAVVTGCNTGIGLYTVLDLYSRGARVVMACRDEAKAVTARDWVQQQCHQGVGSLSLCTLNLSSLSSVRTCAQKILEEEDNIHILINNAGVMMCPRSLSEDGYELHLATNHLGPFLFTLLLLPRVLRSAPARIVNVASLAHIFCVSLNFDDINLEKHYFPQLAYARSKMCNILFTRELAKRLEGSSVRVYCLHPGVVNTELSRHLDSAFLPGIRWLFQNIGGLFWKTPKEGAQTTLYCAVDEATADQTGLYYDDCQVARTNKMAQDDALARQLWDISLEIVRHAPPHPFGKSTDT